MPTELLTRDEHRVVERAEPVVRTRPGPPELTKKPARLQIFLLSCGIAAPLMYVLSDVLIALRWEGYSYRDQTISEL